MKYSILLLLAASTLLSCMTERKRADIFHGYAAENRAAVLDYCPDPVDELRPGKTDTVTVIDTVRVKVPYPVPGTNDTIWVECPETETVYRYIRQTDTLFRENTAEIERLLLLLSESEKRAAVADTRAEISEKRAKERLWIAIAVGALLVVVVVIKIRGVI